MAKNDNTVTIEDAKILFRNFAGKEGKYNAEGDRNFAVLLDDDVAEQMAKDGWNVKWLKPREDDEDQTEQAYLQVSVKYQGRNGPVRAPLILMITSGGRTNLGEEEVELLDWANIQTADLMIRPFEWEVNGKTGVKAYLQSLYVTIEENALELKYSQVTSSPPDMRDGAPPWSEDDDA